MRPNATIILVQMRKFCGSPTEIRLRWETHFGDLSSLPFAACLGVCDVSRVPFKCRPNRDHHASRLDALIRSLCCGFRHPISVEFDATLKSNGAAAVSHIRVYTNNTQHCWTFCDICVAIAFGMWFQNMPRWIVSSNQHLSTRFLSCKKGLIRVFLLWNFNCECSPTYKVQLLFFIHIVVFFSMHISITQRIKHISETHTSTLF